MVDLNRTRETQPATGHGGEAARTDVPGAQPRRVGLVVNARSGSGGADIDAVVGRMKQAGVDVRSVATTDDPSEMTGLARRAAETADIVAIGGGDGTISGTLPVFLETGRALGVLPLGTANDLARSLDIPLDPVLAADILATGEARRIDLGEVNGRPFCNAVTAGFSAEVAANHSSSRKKWLGTLEYPLLWMKAVRAFEPFAVTLDHNGDETRLDRVFMLTVMNGRYHGRGMSVDAAARIDDGLLKIYCIKQVGTWKLMSIFLSLQRGRLPRERDITLLRARRVALSGGQPLPLGVDGDVIGECPANISVLPGAIAAIVPRQAEPGG